MPRLTYSAVALAIMLGSHTNAAQAQDAADRATSAQVASEREVPTEEAKPRPRLEVQTPTLAAPQDQGPGLFVGAVTLAGLQVLSPADFADIIAERIGRTLPPQELAALADAVSSRLRARGFPLGTARIVPQRLSNGVLVVGVDEGTIDEIRLEGPSIDAVQQALAPLRSGRPVKLAEVEDRLLIASDIDGVRILSSRFLREGDRGVLLVRLSYDRLEGYASISDQGTRPIGPEQTRLQIDANGLFASDDALTLSYSAASFAPSELQFGFARYEKRINSSGTEVSISGSGSITRPGSYLEPLDIKNRSWFAGIGVLQPLVRQRRASYWLQGEFGLRNMVQWRVGARTRRDQLAIGRLTLYGYHNVFGGRLRASATLSQGFGILNATKPGDALASRRDSDGTFTTLNAWADWTSELGGDFSMRLAAQGQAASQPLLISEELGLGGTSFLRGYDWGERTGDEGAAGMAEVRYSLTDPFAFMKRAQIYAFVDGGTVSNREDGFGDGSLASTGGGLRLDITSQLGLNLEVAVPITGPRYDTGDRSPKINFSIARSF